MPKSAIKSNILRALMNTGKLNQSSKYTKRYVWMLKMTSYNYEYTFEPAYSHRPALAFSASFKNMQICKQTAVYVEVI